MLDDPWGYVGSCAPLDRGAVLCKELEELSPAQAGAWTVLPFIMLQVPGAFGKRAECLQQNPGE